MKINPGDEEEDYALFGKIVLLWGRIEGELIGITLKLLHPMFEPKIKFKFPSSFDGMMKLATERYRAIQEMAELVSEAESVLQILPALHKTRTIIVHGHYQGLHISGYSFGFYHSRRSEKNRLAFYNCSEEALKVTLKQMEEARAKMEKLARDTFRIFPPAPSTRTAKRSEAKS